MINTMIKRIQKYCTAALLLAAGGTASFADPAIIMGQTICDNQADAFDYDWITSNVADTRLFFLSGDTADDGAINAVGHEDAFNDSATVYISVHGDVDIVDSFSGAGFASLFHNNHATTPVAVTFYVCQSSTVPDGEGAISSKAALARAYPGEAAGSTLIQTVTAPEPDSCPALAVDAAATPFDPIETIAAAVYRTDISQTEDHDTALAVLLDEWGGGNGVTYPETEQSFQAYCEAQLEADASGQWIPDFIANVVTQFSEDYLTLINTNYGGDPLVTCGVDAQCN